MKPQGAVYVTRPPVVPVLFYFSPQASALCRIYGAREIAPPNLGEWVSSRKPIEAITCLQAGRPERYAR
jgi:hypothetical protein